MGIALRLTTRIALAVSATATGALAWGTGSAAAEGVYSGACTMTLDVLYSAPVTLLPAQRSLSIGGGGTCLVNGTVVPVEFTGGAATTALTGGYGCEGGVARGTGVFDVEMLGFPDPLIQIAVVDATGVVTFAGWSLLLTFEGVGELVRDPVDTAACPLSGMTATTWTGAVAFQDPYPPPV